MAANGSLIVWPAGRLGPRMQMASAIFGPLERPCPPVNATLMAVVASRDFRASSLAAAATACGPHLVAGYLFVRVFIRARTCSVGGLCLCLCVRASVRRSCVDAGFCISYVIGVPFAYKCGEGKVGEKARSTGAFFREWEENDASRRHNYAWKGLTTC